MAVTLQFLSRASAGNSLLATTAATPRVLGALRPPRVDTSRDVSGSWNLGAAKTPRTPCRTPCRTPKTPAASPCPRTPAASPSERLSSAMASEQLVGANSSSMPLGSFAAAVKAARADAATHSASPAAASDGASEEAARAAREACMKRFGRISSRAAGANAATAASEPGPRLLPVLLRGGTAAATAPAAERGASSRHSGSASRHTTVSFADAQQEEAVAAASAARDAWMQRRARVAGRATAGDDVRWAAGPLPVLLGKGWPADSVAITIEPEGVVASELPILLGRSCDRPRSAAPESEGAEAPEDLPLEGRAREAALAARAAYLARTARVAGRQ